MVQPSNQDPLQMLKVYHGETGGGWGGGGGDYVGKNQRSREGNTLWPDLRRFRARQQGR